MIIYFDESRNTGEIGASNSRLNYFEQRYFVLVGVVENEEIFNKYKRFVEVNKNIVSYNKQGVGEIKGNDLLKRENTEILGSFFDEFMKGDYCYLTIYDKKYFLVSQMIQWLLGVAFKEYEYVQYLKFCEFLHKLSDLFLIKYISVTKDNSENNIKNFIDYAINYDYSECIGIPLEALFANEWKQMLSLLSEQPKYISILCEENVENVNISKSDRNNIVNLTALGETIMLVKQNNSKVSNSDICIVHDEIEVVQEYIKYYWPEKNLTFEKSEDNIGIQLADNISSVVGKVINNLFPINGNSDVEEILKDSMKWLREYSTIIFDNFDENNIKFVSSMREHATLMSIKNMELKNLNEFLRDVAQNLDSRMNTELNNYYTSKEALELLLR